MQNATRLSAMLLFAAFLASPALGQRSVTLMLNMATNPDTTRTDDMIQVRGA